LSEARAGWRLKPTCMAGFSSRRIPSDIPKSGIRQMFLYNTPNHGVRRIFPYNIPKRDVRQMFQYNTLNSGVIGDFNIINCYTARNAGGSCSIIKRSSGRLSPPLNSVFGRITSNKQKTSEGENYGYNKTAVD